MRVRFYATENATHRRCIEALFEGCPEEKTLTRTWEYEPADVAVMFGTYKKAIPISWPRGMVAHEQEARNARVVIVDSGYLNRGDGPEHHYSVGIGGLNGRADFKNSNSPSDRWDRLEIPMHPWKKGREVILCGQVPWDANCQHINMIQWLHETAKDIQAAWPGRIVYRPHPKAIAALPHAIPGCETSTAPLESDLKNAHAVVTFNSNAAVEAITGGVPVWSMDQGSMVWNVSRHDPLDIGRPLYPDRAQWAYDLAYAQWTPDEMASGETWRHLF